MKSDADKVVFYGFDAQKTEAAAEIVKSYIATTDPAYISTFNSVAEPFLNEFSELDQYTMDQFIKESNALFLKYNSKWEIIQTYLTNNKAKLIEQSSEKDFTLIEQHWKIVKLRFTQMSKINEIESFNYRDSYMAENSNWIYNFEGKRKMILLAHAGHIGNSNSLETQMGYHLKKTHQDKYYAIGLFFNEGSVYAAGLVDGKPQLAEFKLPAKPKHTITRAFVQGGWSSFFLSFSSIASKPSLVNLFKSEYNTYFIGADLENVTVKQILGQFYDGIIFLEKVNGTTPN